MDIIVGLIQAVDAFEEQRATLGFQAIVGGLLVSCGQGSRRGRGERERESKKARG